MNKNQKAKRFLALFLAIVMIAGILPVNIFADDFETSPEREKTAVRAVEAPDWEVSEEELNTDYWPLTVNNRLVEVADGEPIRNPSIEYG